MAFQFDLEPIPPIPDLVARWQKVYEDSDASFFLSPVWITSWLRITQSSPFLFSVSDGHQDVALAIVCYKTGTIRELGRGDLYLNSSGQRSEDRIFIEYNHILTRKSVASSQALFLSELLACSKQVSEIKHAQRVIIPGCRYSANDLGTDEVRVKSEITDRVHFVMLSKVREKESYLELLSANTRYQIRRAVRLQTGDGKINISEASSDEEISNWLLDLRRLHVEKWRIKGLPSSFEDDRFFSFVMDVCLTGIPAGTVQLLRFSVQEDRIGYLINFVSGKDILNYQAAFVDYDDNRFKPGLICHCLAVEHYADAGFDVYNFLSGNAQYKRSLSTDYEDIQNLSIHRLVHKKTIAEKVFGEFIPMHHDNFDGRTHTALVMGDDTRSFLTSVRSLGRQGIIVDAAPFAMNSPALKSRYIRNIHRLPLHIREGAAWRNAVSELINREKYDLVIPCDDRTILLFDKYRGELAAKNRIAIPNHQSIEVLYDKQSTRELAAQLGVAIAPGQTLSQSDTPEALADRYGLPMAVKPRRSYQVHNLYKRYEVTIARTLEELRTQLSQMDDPENYFVEGFFEGQGSGVSVLAADGTIVQSFQHKRLHETGITGGSSLRTSVAINRAMEEAVAKIVAALDYSGLAMFEFRENPDTHEWILLEVNARLWGSVPLPVSLGIDFPFGLFRSQNENAQLVRKNYVVGGRARNLMNDFYSTTSMLESRDIPLARKVLRLAGWLGHFPRIWVGREHSDTFVSDDLMPGMIEFREFLFQKLRNTFHRSVAVLPLTFSHGRARATRLFNEAAMGNSEILFLCYGNICRSPFAAQIFDRLCHEAGSEVKISSVGSFSVEDRSSPELAQNVANTFDIDLSQHRSRYFDEDLAARTGLLFVFDHQNFYWVATRYPELLDRTVYLGDLRKSSKRARQIFDPYGHDEKYFRQQYEDIAETLELFSRSLRRS